MPSRFYRWNAETQSFDELGAEKPEQKGPYIQGDEMPLKKHHVTGKWTSSKREYQRETKNAGHVEVSDSDLNTPRKQRWTPNRDVLERAYYEAKQRIIWKN